MTWLQFYLATYINNDLPGQQQSVHKQGKRALKTFKQRIKVDIILISRARKAELGAISWERE